VAQAIAQPQVIRRGVRRSCAVFIVREYLRRPFTVSFWSFSFPLATSANTAGHWAIAAPGPLSWWLAWSALLSASAVAGLLAI
jgi:tellurite resistance protein